jgi:hypothetical protein
MTIIAMAGWTLGCQEEESKKSEKKDEEKKTEAAGEDGAGEEEESADAPAEEVEPTLTASSYDGSAMTPSEFVAAFNPWVDKEVLIAAHPVFFFDEGELGSRVDLNMDPTSRDLKPAECKMKAEDAEKFNKTRVVVLKSQFDRFWGPDRKLVFKDCEKQELLDKMPSRVENLDPARYDGTTPIPLDQYLEASQWKDKEVVLVGSFNGSTKSTTDYGTSYRIDLYDEGQGSSKEQVAAYLDAEIPQENYGTSKVWKLKCQATGETAFDDPEVEHCEFVEQLK